MRMSSEETAQVTGNLQFCFAKQRAWQPQSDWDAGPGILIEMPWTPSYSKGPARRPNRLLGNDPASVGSDFETQPPTQLPRLLTSADTIYSACVWWGVISHTVLWMKKSFRELKWLLESHQARKLQKWTARAVLTTGTLATIVPSGMQNLSLSRLADAESASLMQSAHDAYAHATEWHCCGCYSLLCMLSPAEAETKGCRGAPQIIISVSLEVEQGWFFVFVFFFSNLLKWLILSKVLYMRNSIRKNKILSCQKTL